MRWHYGQPPHADDAWPLVIVARIPPRPVASGPAVYLDDAGTNKRFEPDCIWAGYIATHGLWRRMGDRWNKILDRRPHLPFWHQSRAVKRDKPFDGLSDPQFRRRQKSLFKLIGDNLEAPELSGLVPIAVRVSHAEIEKHVTGKIKPTGTGISNKVLERPNFVALYWLAKACDEIIEDLHKQGPEYEIPLSMYCERSGDDPYQTHMHGMWYALQKKYPKRFGEFQILPGKDRRYPQTQIADVLAWHTNALCKGRKEPTLSAVAGDFPNNIKVSEKQLKLYVYAWNTDLR